MNLGICPPPGANVLSRQIKLHCPWMYLKPICGCVAAVDKLRLSDTAQGVPEAKTGQERYSAQAL